MGADLARGGACGGWNVVQLSGIMHGHNIKPLALTCSTDCQTTDGNNGPRNGRLFLVLPDLLVGWSPTAALARTHHKPGSARRGPSSPWRRHFQLLPSVCSKRVNFILCYSHSELMRRRLHYCTPAGAQPLALLLMLVSVTLAFLRRLFVLLHTQKCKMRMYRWLSSSSPSMSCPLKCHQVSLSSQVAAEGITHLMGG